MMKNTVAIYTVIAKGRQKMPYPPVAGGQGVDFLCFTDDRDMVSKYWKICYMEELPRQDEGDCKEGFPHREDGVHKKGFPHRKDGIRRENFPHREAFPLLRDYQFVMYLPPDQILLQTDSLGRQVVEVPSLESCFRKAFPQEYDTHCRYKAQLPGGEGLPHRTVDDAGNYIYPLNPRFLENGGDSGAKCLLTVGVPVSNQIETIRRCLDHLKPLFGQLDAELLVIDTGSTDGTVEAAREYGARVVDFPWRDDMSAARNVGIANAWGEWYLSIDDDEWFENTDKIVRFFQSGDYRQYAGAHYIQRNYMDSNGQVFHDHYTLRMARITRELHFEGRIHDAMTLGGGSVATLADVAHHYGFVTDDRERALQKFKRNASLLWEDLREFPNHLRYHFQMAKECNQVCLYEEAAGWFFRGLSLEREFPDPYWRKNHMGYLLATFYNAKDERLFAYAELFLGQGEFSAPERAFLHFILHDMAYAKQREPRFVLEHGLAYERYCGEVLGQSQGTADTGFHFDVWGNLQYVADHNAMMFDVYLGLGEEGKAQSYLERLDASLLLERQYDFWRLALRLTGEFQEACLQKLTPVSMKAFWECLQDAVRQGECGYQDIFPKLDPASLGDSIFYHMIGLFADPRNEGQWDWFAEHFMKWEADAPVILGFALDQGMDFLSMISCIPVEALRPVLKELWEGDGKRRDTMRQIAADAGQGLGGEGKTTPQTAACLPTGQGLGDDGEDAPQSTAMREDEPASVQILYFLAFVAERAMISLEDAPETVYMEQFLLYIQCLARYGRHYYQDALFLEGQEGALLPGVAAAVVLSDAIAREQDAESEGTEYVRSLKRALRICPAFKRGISVLSDQWIAAHRQEEQQTTPQDELATLGNALKQQAQDMIASGKVQEAAQLLGELAMLLPGDETVGKLLEICTKKGG